MPADDFEVFDPRFEHLVKQSAHVDHLWTGARWTEGPAWFPASRSLIFSDIPNDRLLRFDEANGHVSVFREGQNRYCNGNTIDRHGRLVSCEHGGRRVTRIEHDGSVTVVADRFEGKRFNSPNDVVVRSDGSVWFTDPSYGIDSDYEGFAAVSEIGSDNVYRVDPDDGSVTMVTDLLVRPNGLAFSPDEQVLYIVDSSGPKLGGQRTMRRFDVNDDGSLSGGDVFAEPTVGTFDGFRLDTAGRIWTSDGDGVSCIGSDGMLLGRVKVPESVSNVTFGGAKRNRLFITATTSVYAVLLPVNGVALV
jgi:gluconolactonase